ncbi:hypothetical protein JCM8547_000110 [Rhodosporidiobolus lusitaniae]
MPQKRPLPTILVLDHHDSYTRNILSLISRLSSADSTPGDEEAAAPWDCEGWKDRVFVVSVDSLSWDSFVTDILPHLDCVILGPGPGTPHNTNDFSWPQRLLEELGDRLPIFGLCLGCQGLATVFGGKVVKAASPKHGQISLIRLNTPLKPAVSSSTAPLPLTAMDLFNGVPSPFSAVQYNSLVVDPASLPNELEVLAWTAGADGKDEVMALRHRKRPLWGVQFHPESIESTYGARILSNFFSLALDFHSSRSPPSSPLSPKPNLPPYIIALSTSYSPRPPIPRVPQGKKRWEQRTVRLDGFAEGWTPQMVFEAVVKGKSELGEVWLDSARPSNEPQLSHVLNPHSTWSYSIAQDSLVIRSTISSSSTSISTQTFPLSSLSSSTSSSPDLFDILTASHTYLRQNTSPPSPTSSFSTPPAIPIGFVGYFGYEMKDVSLPLSRRKRTQKEEEKEQEEGRSDAEFAFAATVLSYEHQTGEWLVSGLVRLGEDGKDELDSPETLVQNVGVTEEAWSSWLSFVRTALSSPPPSSSSSPSPTPLQSSLTPRQSRISYLSSIRSAQSLIRSGDTYELCLTTSFSSSLSPSSPLASDPYPAYLSLRASNPAPYSAYFRLPLSGSQDEVEQGGLAILSSSPERFLRISASGQACMKPIKGTSRRCLTDSDEDERRKEALEGDAKERAENLMIVDLIRNDLLACCEVESVKVEGLMKVETYETVHQLVTTVTGSLSPGVSPVEAVKASVPPGSMTGAPKLRSVQLLGELEGREKRGVYSGIFGYLSISGASDWSVVIRTLVKRGLDVSLGAGGAITHLSEPGNEWEEVLTKIDAVLGGGGGTVQQEDEE